MIDIDGFDISGEDRELLLHPAVGGLILFTRNFKSVDQISRLVKTIHTLREPRLLVAIDHEGGRIQRFREGFTRLPACELLGKTWDKYPETGLKLSEQAGWLMASELLACGIDFSFAPVLDINKGISSVIGDRSFHRNPDVVGQLAHAYMTGMKHAGMPAVGKHFPGHGSVTEDSHLAIPVDKRRFEDIQMDDLIAFERMIHAGLPAIMPAHVIYPAVDSLPAGFSSVWLKDILRGRLGFKGTIFSDDISMAGAEIIGDYMARAHGALNAGCDMVLICNNRTAVLEVLENYRDSPNPLSQVRLIRMHGKTSFTSDSLRKNYNWQQISARIDALTVSPELNLNNDDSA